MFIGSFGGALFAYFSFPLAWMMGAMIAVTIAALSGLPVHVPIKIRSIFVSILGVMLGSAFTPALITKAGDFGSVLLIQILYMIIAGSSVFLIYRFIAKYDPVTSYFSSTPGGLSEMTLVGEQFGGDPRIIPLNHSIRILIIVTLIPFYFRFIQGIDVPVAPPEKKQLWNLYDIIILSGCIFIGYPIAHKLRMPAAALIGPMILSATVHLAGITQANVPSILVAVSQLIVGTSLGCRFTNRMSFKEMSKVIWIAVFAALIMITIALLIVSLTNNFFSISSTTLFLSIAPGGLAEMSLIALALGTGTAFVTVMHFLRVTCVMLLGAAVFKLINKKTGFF